MPTIAKHKDRTDKTKQAYDFFIGRGYTPEQASGIVGNLLKESNLSTSAEGDVGYSGGSSFGIAQWRGERLKNLQSRYGSKWKDFNSQLEFIDWELNNTEKKAGQALKNSKDVFEAGAVISDLYERPKVKFNQDKNRQSHVLNTYKKLANSEYQGESVTTDVNNLEFTQEMPNFASVPDTEIAEQKTDKDVEEVKQQTAEYNFLQEIQNAPQREALVQQEEQQPQQRQQVQTPNYLQQFEQISQFVDSPLIAQQGRTWQKQQENVKAEKLAKLRELLKDKNIVKNLEAKAQQRRNQVPTERTVAQVDATKTARTNNPDKTSLTARNKTDKEIAEERQARIDAQTQANAKPFDWSNFRQSLSDRSQATGDALRISNEPNFFDDYVNPAAMIGSMADNIGQAPLRAQQEDSYMPYFTAIGTPLAVGALAGLGTNGSTKQFVNNLANPLAGTGDLVNNLGNKYLPNAYKLNPLAEKLKQYNRIVGEDAVSDLIGSGLVRTPQKLNNQADGVVNLSRKGTTPFPSFGEGIPNIKENTYAQNIINSGKKPYIISTDTPMGVSTLGRHGKGSTLFPIDEYGKYLESFPANKASVFEAQPNWLKGYKQIEIPKEELVDLYRIQQKGAETFAERAKKGTLHRFFNNPETLARKAEEEKYFGRWFTNDKADLDWYLKDREFSNPEYLHVQVPKSQVDKYNISNFDKTLSRAPEREFILPQEIINKSKRYTDISQFQQGGQQKYTENELAFLSEIAIKDNEGYWNPNNAGKVVEIDSNHITMKGVQKPIKAVSKQTGEEKILYPDKDYVFENTSQVIEMPITQYGGHVLRFQGGGIKTPIYKNLEDFYNQNKEVTTYNSDDKSTLPLLTSYNKYDDSLEYEYCTDIDCMTKANRVIDAFATRNSFFEDTFNKTKPNIGANLSTKTKPTPQEAEQNPYFKEDEKFGSLDSWDVAKQYEKTSPKSIVFSSSGNKKNNINYSQLEQKYKDKIAVGSFIGLGNHDFKDGEQRANHTVRVTGFLSDGEPLVADYGKIVPLSRAMYIEGDKSRNTIAHILNIPGKEKYTFNHFNDIEKAKNVKTGKKYINNLNSLPVIEDGKVGYKKPSEDYVKYHNVIGDEKTYITKALGINDETYDRYAKIALTLGANETKYGTSKVYKYLNSFKDSKGVAQLREENVSDRYKETLSKYKKDSPEYNAVATMLYIKELDKYKDKWLDKGKNNTERVFKRQDEETIKNTVRNFQGKKQMGYLNSDFGNDIFRDGDIEFEMPYKQPWQSEEDYKKEVDQELRDKKLSDIYSFKINNGKREIVKKTKGTTIPNTLEDLVFYAWQSPTTVVSGDAQGDSNYYKKNKQYYNLLFPK